MLITPITPPTVTASLIWLAVLAAAFAVLIARARTRTRQPSRAQRRPVTGHAASPKPIADARDARCELDQRRKAA